MKRFGVPLIIFAGIILTLWIIGRLTNALQFFSAPTISNYPTIKNGDKFFASNLVTPNRFDFICYYVETPEFGKQIWTHRLCGIPGDKIEIKNGILWVHDKNADADLSLSHNYSFSKSELAKLAKFQKVDEYFIHEIATDSFVVYADDKIITTNLFHAARQVLPGNYSDEYISKRYGKNWNQDNFGPVIVPEDKYFVLGDNRLNSQDSRYLGFIDKSEYVATVLGHK